MVCNQFQAVEEKMKFNGIVSDITLEVLSYRGRRGSMIANGGEPKAYDMVFNELGCVPGCGGMGRTTCYTEPTVATSFQTGEFQVSHMCQIKVCNTVLLSSFVPYGISQINISFVEVYAVKMLLIMH